MTVAANIDAPRVWMNVTTSANWERPPVGIVRVEQEIYRALSASLGARLKPCILREGRLVPYSGTIGSVHAELSNVDDCFAWPDPSFDFPQTVSLDPMPFARLELPAKRASRSPKPSRDQIGFGDIVVSVGLDWDWQNQQLHVALYELKTKRDVKVITCCYDLIPVLFPQYCVGDVAAKFKEYFTNLTWSSSGILCISKRSEADYLALATQLGMPRVPTQVMLLGNKLPEVGGAISDTVTSLCESRFILYVSTIERRKNHEILYKALHILAERRHLEPDFKLVFVGMPGWGVSDLLKDIELDPLVKDHIIQFHHANDAELRMLYEACEFFVYPSFYEGWGLPVAEALALGKFVIASDRGSIPEVGGDLVEYADPWNATQWANLIYMFWVNPALAKSRAERIKSDYHAIEWEETIEPVIKLIDDLGSSRRTEIQLEPGYQMNTLNGVPMGSAILIRNGHGNFTHGPYYPLPRGEVKILLEIERMIDEPTDLLFEFSCGKGTSIIKRDRRRLSGKKLVSNLSFFLALKHDVDDFEIVIDCHSDANISLNKASIILEQKVN